VIIASTTWHFVTSVAQKANAHAIAPGIVFCRVYLPVFVEGANLSMGDMHFSQGDGEVSFCGAIEMSGYLELR
jgi:acetamidase/formamidase